jgi:hypothetical protein
MRSVYESLTLLIRATPTPSGTIQTRLVDTEIGEHSVCAEKSDERDGCDVQQIAEPEITDVDVREVCQD